MVGSCSPRFDPGRILRTADRAQRIRRRLALARFAEIGLDSRRSALSKDATYDHSASPPDRTTDAEFFVVALLLVFAGLGTQYTFKVLSHRSAFVRWQGADPSTFDSGENIYQRFAYPNPPVMAVLLRPLAKMGSVAEALTWFCLKVAMALLAGGGLSGYRAGGVPFAVARPQALLSLRPIVRICRFGNISIFILFLGDRCLYAWHLRRDFASRTVASPGRVLPK